MLFSAFKLSAFPLVAIYSVFPERRRTGNTIHVLQMEREKVTRLADYSVDIDDGCINAVDTNDSGNIWI